VNRQPIRPRTFRRPRRAICRWEAAWGHSRHAITRLEISAGIGFSRLARPRLRASARARRERALQVGELACARNSRRPLVCVPASTIARRSSRQFGRVGRLASSASDALLSLYSTRMASRSSARARSSSSGSGFSRSTDKIGLWPFILCRSKMAQFSMSSPCFERK